jgi:hypothetical protein
MALADQFLGQVRDDPLGASIKLWRAAFGERCNLGDFHEYNLLI